MNTEITIKMDAEETDAVLREYVERATGFKVKSLALRAKDSIIAGQYLVSVEATCESGVKTEKALKKPAKKPAKNAKPMVVEPTTAEWNELR